MSDLALFDLDEPDTAKEAPDAQSAVRPTWGATPCHVCQEPLRRFVRQDPSTGWYRWEIDHTAWDHLRAHEHGRLLLRIMPFSVGSTNGAQIQRRPA